MPTPLSFPAHFPEPGELPTVDQLRIVRNEEMGIVDGGWVVLHWASV